MAAQGVDLAAVTGPPITVTAVPAVANGGRLVVQTWLISRLLLVGTALWVGLTTHRSAGDLFANWDVQHYFAIAANGYTGANDIAFFPGWPLVLHVLSLAGVPLVWVGVAVALTCSALAAAALHRLGGPVAAIAWLLAPTTVFTFVPYTEAPFCAAAFWAWERAQRGRWAGAAALAAVACTLRVSGLFLVGALAVLALTDRTVGVNGSPPTWSVRLRALSWLLIPVGTLGGYAGYLHHLTGDWNAWYHAQATGWPRGFTWPWVSLRHTLDAAASNAYPAFPEWSWVFRGELVSMAVGVVVTIVCLVRRRWGEASWVGVQVVAFSCSYWFLSVNRAVLLWFPLFTLIGAALSGGWHPTPTRHGVRVALTGLGLIAAGAALCFWAWLFYTGRWAS